MKLWKKIFLYSLTLFFILFTCSGIVFIEKIYKDNLQFAIESTMNKYLNTKSLMDLNSDKLLDIDINNFASIKNWLEITVNGYDINNVEDYNTELYSQDNQMIMSNFNGQIEGKRKEILEAKENEKTFIIRDINNKKYVFVSSVIKLRNKNFKLIVSKDIDYVYKKRIDNYRKFLMLDLSTNLILAMGMYIISKNLTNPLVKLSDVSKDIAKGDYSKRAEESNNNDEIGILEKNFNIMIDVIENNIEELKYLNDSKQRFIDSLTHEIKTPITSIIGYSDLLLKSKVNEEIRVKALSYINSEAKRLESLNSTLLKLIFIKQENTENTFIDIESIIDNSIKTMNYKLQSNNIDIKIRLKNVKILVDRNLIEVLISNLIDNSIKASKENSSIEIDGYFNNDNYVLSIRDYGIGIPKEDLDKVKEPFYMVDKARTRKNNGVGLGLSICSEICKIYNISFDIYSKLNEGTVITLTFNKESLKYE